MRAPTRRTAPRRVVAPAQGVDLEALALRVSYVGSPEHKDAPSFAGQPRPRGDASICDRVLAGRQVDVTSWLREAVRRGAIGAFFEGDFPRYAWFKNGDTVFEARLVNRSVGSYKGYPLEPGEWPAGLETIYG